MLQRKHTGAFHTLVPVDRVMFVGPAVTRGDKRKLHLHCLHYRQRLPRRDDLSDGDAQKLYEAGHRGRDPVSTAGILVLAIKEVGKAKMPTLAIPEDRHVAAAVDDMDGADHALHRQAP